MIGISNLPLRTGGYMIPVETIDSTNKILEVNVPAGSRIMCANCTLENQSALESDGSVLSTTNGFFINKNINGLKILRPVTELAPLTILKGREFLYCDNIGSKFNLLKGSRVNGIMCEVTGENIIPEKNNYLIEL